jgi:hypothetical protein
MTDMTASTAVERLEALQAKTSADKERAIAEAVNIIVLASSSRVKAAYLAALERLERSG